MIGEVEAVPSARCLAPGRQLAESEGDGVLRVRLGRDYTGAKGGVKERTVFRPQPAIPAAAIIDRGYNIL
jgi:hypothetical protein